MISTEGLLSRDELMNQVLNSRENLFRRYYPSTLSMEFTPLSRHFLYVELWMKLMMDGVNASPRPCVTTNDYIVNDSYLGNIIHYNNKVPKHMIQCYYNNDRINL